MRTYVKNFLRFISLAVLSHSVLGLDPYFESFDFTTTYNANNCQFTGSNSNKWCYNFPMSRQGFFLVDFRGDADKPLSTLSNIAAGTQYYGNTHIDGGYLMLRGVAANSDLAYNNIWTGRTARLDTLYSATPTQPFGFQVIRYFAVIDPSLRDNDKSIYHQAALSLWLIQNNSVSATTNLSASSPTADWATINNFVFMYEKQDNEATASSWGFYNGAESSIALSTLKRTNYDVTTDNLGSGNNGLIFTATNNGSTGTIRTANDGSGANYTANCNGVANTVITAYDVNPGGLAGAGGVNHEGSYRCFVGNRRQIGMRMTHDGTTVRMYMNPNPHGNAGTVNGVNYAGFRNEWYLVASQNVPFSDNMKVMFGQEQLHHAADMTEAVYDNFLVRPVAQSITAQISSPVQGSDHRVLQGAPQQYEVKITPTFNAEDAGIGEIYIKKPSSVSELFNGQNWDFTNVTVCLDNDTDTTGGSNCNNAGEQKISYKAGSNNLTNNSTLAASEFQAYTLNGDFSLAAGNTGDVLAIRLKKTSQAANNIFRNLAAGAHVRVYFTLTAANTNVTGNDFKVWAHNEKFNDTAQEYVLDNANGLRYATTERALVPAASSGALTVKAYTQPAGTMAASLSPSPLFWGDYLPFATVELRTGALSTGSDITRAIIELPPEGDTPFAFTLVDGGTVTSLIDSLKIPNS